MDAKEKAIKHYPTASDCEKQVYEELFGKETFAPTGYESIKSYEDACKYLGLNPEDNLPYKTPTNEGDELTNVQRMYTTFCEAINKIDGYLADFSNKNQKKWYTWIYLDDSGGLGFTFTFYVYGTTVSGLGSRFCYFSSEKVAIHVFNHTKDMLKKLLTLGSKKKISSYKEVTSYEIACEVMGKDPIKNLPYQNPESVEDEIANYQRKYLTICQAVNKLDDNFIPDFKNHDQQKHYSWFKVKPSGGLGFTYSTYVLGNTFSYLGSRFCYHRNSEVAKHVFENFSGIIEKLVTL